MGRDNDEIVKRPCIMNDEFTFGRDGSYKYDSNGDFWAEGGVFEPANECRASTPDNMKGPNGEDLSAFGDGTHTFTLINGAKPTLTVTGLGAFIGLSKIGTDREVKVPQQSTTLDIIKLTDGAVDTLILESDWKFPDNMGNNDDAYWKIVLVHYDNPDDEPPVAGFKADVAGSTVAFTNISYDATTYNWNFGDGSSSSEANPSHTYANAGLYTVVLTATRGNATSTAQLDVTISANMTEADLIGGAWKVRPDANSIFVGPALGSNAWWGVPLNFLDGSSTGTDDWSCITNDEFIFSAGGVYEYKTNGDARNDGYMGSPNGCISDAQLAASGNGAAFGSAVHSFAFTPAAGSSRPIITLTNGATGAAFVGFYKGYYGGENSDSANPPNGGSATNRYEVMSYVNDGTTETLTLSVDISAAKDGSAAWTVVLIR
ncbi:MAG: PKD domain-containing protein [Haliscomenobacteraceae bacterium CHB4]|nr:PKD domain-containing protein [Haliscomenobacteraceae bacterium CHB4]